jgi:hypothetical protein
MMKKILILLLVLPIDFLASCVQSQQENPEDEPKYHSLILSSNLQSNQEDEDNVLDGTLVIINLLVPEDKQIAAFKYNGVNIKDQLDGLRYAFEIKENVVLVLELMDKPKCHKLTLSSNLTSNQEDEDNILDGTLVIINLLVPDDKQIATFKYNGVDIKDQLDGLRYAFEIEEDVNLVLELIDKSTEPEIIYYQLDIPNEIQSNQVDNSRILAGFLVVLTISVPPGKELISLKINQIEKSDEIVDNTISFYMNESKQVTIELADLPSPPEDYYAVYINIDGFAQYYYDEAVRREKIPNLQKYVGLGTSFTNLETVYPSITGPVQAMIVSAATSERTHNVYKYFDVTQNKVILQGRENDAETFYEKALAANLTVASVRHFIADNVLSQDNLRALYVGAPTGVVPDATVRFDQAIKLVKGEEFNNSGRIQQLNFVPQLLTIYVDDIDGIGHNSQDETYGIPRASTEAGRIDNVINALSVIDAKIEELVLAYKAKGIYEKTVFVITTDHGMTPYGSESGLISPYTMSKFSDLKSKFESLNSSYKLEYLDIGESPKSNTTVVAFGSSLNVGITFLGNKPTQSELLAIKTELEKENYVMQVLTRNELITSGVWRGAGIDLVITPSERYHFSNNASLYVARGNHDTYHETSRCIFGVVFGGPIKQQVITTVERNVSLGLVVADTLNITLFHSDKTKRLDVFIDE